MIYVGIEKSKVKSKAIKSAKKIGKKVVVDLPCLCADDCSRHFELLIQFDKNCTDWKHTEYYKFCRKNKRSHKFIINKITEFKKLYESIKTKGYRTKRGHIIVSKDGARLDGSHRASIVEHLDYKKLQIIIVNWDDLFTEKELSLIKKHLKSQKKKYNA